MKLIHKDWTFEMLFHENTVQRVIVENPQTFTQFIQELQEWIGGADNGWILSQDGKLRKPSKDCELIIDYFNLDINQRKMITYLYSQLELEINNTELLLSWKEMSGAMEQIVEKAVEKLEYDITYSEADIKSCLKMLGVSFQSHGTSCLERLMEYQELLSDVLDIRLFILVNATTYFTTEELKFLYEQAFYKKYYLLFLDTQQIEVFPEKENLLIIDKDACIIQQNLQ